MGYDGKQLKNGTVANSKLATASNTASANSVVLSKSDSKIDISYIPTDDPILRRNFSYTSLTGDEEITIPEGQTMLIYEDIDIEDDASIVIDGDVIAVSQDLVNIRPWKTTVFGSGTYTLSTGKINKYNTLGSPLTLYLPAGPVDGDVVELKEVGNFSTSATLTTLAGTTQIESFDSSSHSTSVSLAHSKLYAHYKWDEANSVWRLVGSINKDTSGGGSSTQIEDELTTSVTTTDGNEVSATGLSDTPNAFSVLMVYLNGILLNHISYGSKTGSLYFSNDGGSTAAARVAITTGTKLYWNGSVSGFELESGWIIKVIYAA